MRRLCAAEWFLSHPASEVITLSTLSTGGGALFFFGENFYSAAQRRRAQSQPPPCCEYAAPAQIAPLRNLNASPPPSALHEPANLHCCSAVNRHSAVAVFFFPPLQQNFQPPPPKPSEPVTTAKLHNCGKFCRHERRKGQP